MIPIADLLEIAAITGGTGLVIAAAGLALMWVIRDRSVGAMLAVVAAVTVAATLGGVVATTFKMLINPHDRSVVLTVVAVGGMVGFGVALLLARRVVADSRRLLKAVQIVPMFGQFTPPEGRMPTELATISKALEEAHESLREARERERALDASRRELVAWVSHDLRTPLAGLRAMAEALEDGIIDDPATVQRYYGQIRLEAGRLTQMVDDLFELSRINAGALSLSRHRIGLDDLVADTLAGVEALARAKGVRLHGASQGMLPVEVDSGEVGRALRNLVVNAIRHTPADGSVSVQAGVVDGMACVSVSDACGGIPEDDLPRVFEVAFRGSAARTPGPDGGAGLGLAIARGIVEAHMGAIGVCNTGPGCRFMIRLPLSV
ncbi:sensor histidine kinase [Rhizohabitans arisaemae]|uniref:sensor histidine kinase n=1 Tax=Rhizohabitans arisaemae TaxID=2720610 RepID=UPI0024B256F0|nr:HAMP domain-containing sensor histidine kinase [Rhizohabitans arisaemae]